MANRFIVALVVVFLLAGPYLANLLKDLTRYLYMWQASDMALLLGGMVFVALICVLICEVLRWTRRPLLTRIYNHLFVLVLGAGLLTNLWFHTQRDHGWHIGQFGMEMQTFWLMLVGLVGYSFARADSKLVLHCKQLCLIISPGTLIIALQLLTQNTYHFAHDPLVHATPASITGISAVDNKSPIYIFVFDEWSYERSYDDGRLRPLFVNLSALSEHSIVFHDAHSPGEDTATSMPRLLFQTDMTPVADNGRVGFDHEGVFVPSRDRESIFSLVSEQDYNCILTGVFLPYPAWLGDQVDICRTYCFYPRGDNLITRAAIHVFNAMYYQTDPWSIFLYVKLKTRIVDGCVLELYRNVKQDILEVIQTQPRSTFALFHYLLPHEPYILDVDGNYRGLDKAAWCRSNIEGYQRNLVCLDKLIGEFVTAMKRAGRFDDALVILTSDHSWRFDPAKKSGDDLTHVPLIVKLPGQTEPLSVTRRFENLNLGKSIEFVLQTGADPTQVECFLDLMKKDSAMDVVSHDLTDDWINNIGNPFIKEQ